MMFIFNCVDRCSNDDNFGSDGIHIPKGCWINLNRFFASNISVATLKQQEGDNPFIAFMFRGTLEMKVGLARPGYSFTWLCDRRLSASDWEAAEISLDLTAFNDGTLEISFLGLDESALSRDIISRDSQLIDSDMILYNFISPTLDLCCEEQIYYKFSGENIQIYAIYLLILISQVKRISA